NLDTSPPKAISEVSYATSPVGRHISIGEPGNSIRLPALADFDPELAPRVQPSCHQALTTHGSRAWTPVISSVLITRSAADTRVRASRYMGHLGDFLIALFGRLARG